jgi:tRNA threonylcarbamoyladenosine biosynthesis protein TsaE
MNIYNGNFPIYHFDIFRLDEPEELYDLDYEEYFYGNGIAIVEWSERLGHLLPQNQNYLKVSLDRGYDDNQREIKIEAVGINNTHWKEVLKNSESTGN